MKRSDFTRRILAGLLAVLMITTSIPGTVLADEVKVGDRIITETADTESVTEQNGVFEDEKLIDESQTSEETNNDNSEEGDVNSLNAVDATDANDEEGLSEEISEGDLEEVFYRELTDAEEEAKEELTKDVSELEDASDDDYAQDEVIYLCDSEEEAEKAAEAYAEATGYEVSVTSFQYGVAVLGIKKSKASANKLNKSGINAVQEFVTLAADEDNNLPAVYPNYKRYAYSVNTDYESFSDPFLKKDYIKTVNEKEIDYSPYFQWYHETVNDKFVWKALEENKLDASKLSSVTVGVIDTGINASHPEFAGIIAEKKDFATVDSATYQGDDQQGHGTNVSGIIASKANELGGRGVASGVKIISARVFPKKGPCLDSYIISAMRYMAENAAEKNIKVINMSLGGPCYSGAYLVPIKEVNEAGILIVAAAGNENTVMCAYPASFEGVMSVAAVDDKFEKASFSNYGTDVDICAPGGTYRSNGSYYIKELWEPSCENYEDHIFIDENGSGNWDSGEVYGAMAGTSQATPVVASAAAMVFAYNPSYTPKQVESRLERTSTPVKSKYGIGAGCVNVAAALGISSTPTSPQFTLQSSEDVISTTASLDSGSELVFGVNSSDTLYEDTCIYYTKNGKNPDPDNMASTGTCIAKIGDNLELPGSGKITIKAMSLLYGQKSQIVTYNITIKDSYVASIGVTDSLGNYSLEDENNPGSLRYFEVSEGKKLTLKADIAPSYAKNKKVKWESDDTSVATVSASGQVTAIAAGEADITVTALDRTEGAATTSVKIIVKELAKQVIINKDEDIITLDVEETYDFADGEIIVKPSTASDKVSYKSSNVKVATVDSNGTITGVQPGTAKITVTAADGSNVSDVIDVKVLAAVTKVEIYDPSGNNVVGGGKKLNLQAKFNDGKSVPSDKGLTWEIIDDEDSSGATIDENTGEITTYSVSSKKTIVVQATSVSNPSVISEEMNVDIYPAIYNLESLPKGYYGYTSLGVSQIEISANCNRLLSMNPAQGYSRLKVTSSNPSVVSIEEKKVGDVFKYYLHPNKVGSAKITWATLDGSNLTASTDYKVFKAPNVETELGLQNTSDTRVIYPGKTLSYNLVGDLSKYHKVRMGHIDGKDAGDDEDSYGDVTSYKGLSFSGMNITASKTPYNNAFTVEVAPMAKDVDELYRPYIYDYYYGWIILSTSVVEYYPAGTKSITINSTEENDINSLVLKPGDVEQITPSSLPANACQKYYTYASSNNKVATVSEDGYIEAVANGTAKITVTAGDGSKVKKEITVTVEEPASSVDITSKTGNFTVGSDKTLQLIATVDAAAGNKTVTWKIGQGVGDDFTEDTTYATIDAKGLVKAKTIGSKQTVVVRAVSNSTSNVYKDQVVTLVPLTATLTADVKAVTVYSSVVASEEYIGELSGKNIGEFKVKATSGTKTAPGPVDYSTYTVTSSNENVATAEIYGFSEPEIDANGQIKIIVTGVAKGTAKITVKAGDGSNKSVTCNVTVNQPVTSLELVSSNGVTTLTAGKSITLKAVTNADATNKNVTYSLNQNDITFEKAEDESKKNCFELTNSSKGIVAMAKGTVLSGKVTIPVTATANDGSGVADTINLTAYKATVSKVEIVSASEVIKSVNLAQSSIGDINSSETYLVKFTDTNGAVGFSDGSESTTTYAAGKDLAVTSSKPDIAGAEVNNDGELVVTAHKTGKANITVKTVDGTNKSASIAVNVVQPVRQLSVYSKTGLYNVTAGSSLQMVSSVNSDASSKAVAWTVLYPNNETVPNTIATIDAKGVLKVAANSITEKTTIYVKAIATDGSKTSNRRMVTIYPAQTTINVSGPTTMNVGGDDIYLTFTPATSNACDDYLVTYNKGCARVQYVTTAQGTKVKVTAIKKGKVTVTATAQDGSGKKVSHNITIN